MKMDKFFRCWLRDKPIPKGNIWRALSAKEKLLLKRGENENLQISSMIFTSSKHQLKEKNIIRSLRNIAERNPLLQASVVKTHKDYYWRQMDEIRINYTQDTQTIDWKEICSDLLPHKYDVENGPLWQMIHFPDIESEYQDGNLPYLLCLPI